MSGTSVNVSGFSNYTTDYINTTTVDPPGHCKWYLPALEWLKIAMLTFGFLGNGATAFIIIIKKDLHSKTYATICAIALSDFLYCLGGVLWGVFYYAYMDPHDFRVLQNCVSEFVDKYMKIFIKYVMTSAYVSSGFLIAVLSIFRYIIIVHPLKANMILTKRAVVLTFAFVYFVAIGYAVLLYTKVIKNTKISRPIDTVLSYLIPLNVMVVFHTLKLSKIKSSGFQATKTTARKMEVVVIMVVMAFFLLLLPWHVVSIGYEFGILKPSYSVVTASALLLQLNNCINPVFYAFLSPLVRKSLCFCFQGKKDTNRRNPTGTQSTALSSSSSGLAQTRVKSPDTPSSITNSSSTLNSSISTSDVSTYEISSQT